MYLDVDALGVDSVIKWIDQTGLPKFVIFRKGVGKGSIPVFEYINGDNNEKAKTAFKNWANSIIQSNPYNSQAYEILLFNKATDRDDDDDDEQKKILPADANNRARTRRKEGKIRFSFALNSNHVLQGGFNQMPINNGLSGEEIERKITDGINRLRDQDRIRELEQRLNELENGDDDDDDDDKGESTLDKVYKVVSQINLNEKLNLKKKKAAQINNDLDDDDDEDLEEEEDEDLENDDLGDDEDEEEEEIQPKKKTTVKKPANNSAAILKKRERIKKALRVLNKYTNDLDGDLICLAKFAQNNPKQFTGYMKTLRNLS